MVFLLCSSLALVVQRIECLPPKEVVEVQFLSSAPHGSIKTMKSLGFIYAISAAVLWGLVYNVDQKILTKTSPVTLLFVYYFVGVIALLPIVFFKFDSLKTLFSSGKTTIVLIISAIVLTALAEFSILSAVKILGASAASIFEIAYPLFVVLFGILLFKAIPNLYFFIGGTLIFLGSLIIIKLA